MDKKRLTTLIKQPEQLEEKDFKELSTLKAEYPYFQAISPLITLGSKTYSPKSEKKHLQSAALYALDRRQLKKILTGEANDISKEETKDFSRSNKVTGAEKETAHEGLKQEGVIDLTSTSTHLPESFFEELFKEMEALKAEKENYLRTLERVESEEAKQTKAKPTTKTAAKSATSKSKTPKKTSEKPATGKKATAKKSQSEKSLATQKGSAKAASRSTTKKTSTTSKSEATKKTSTTKKAASTKANSAEKKNTKATTAKRATKAKANRPHKDEHDIIQEITSRKELKINDAHKKEQLDIINSFIENEPILTKRGDLDDHSSRQEAEDLSANSTNLSDDLVSETLAKLMIKQGRKKKAIDIYKKLIWKFPQKKTYFVEIIGELKKES